MIIEKLKCVFIHIPKTGGTSVEESLKFLIPPSGRHMFAKVAKGILKEEWNTYYKWTIVRNTFDRLVSLYFFCKKLESENAHNENFNYWLEKILNKGHCRDLPISQLEWLETDGKIEIDFVGKFESLDCDFKKVVNLFKVEAKLLHLNATCHSHYSNYYNRKLINVVYKFLGPEIEYFNYHFNLKVI